MGRPKQFERKVAVERAMRVFAAKGFAGSSMNDLLGAIGIGRQSLYDEFGSKKDLYLEALARFHRERLAVHIARLKLVTTPLVAIETFLLGMVEDSQATPENGFLAVGAIIDFCNADTQVAKARAEGEVVLRQHLVARLKEAKDRGDIWRRVDCEFAACFIEIVTHGLQIAARSGASQADLKGMVQLAVHGVMR